MNGTRLDTELVFYAVFESIASCLCILGNALVIATYCCQRSIHTVTTTYVVSLAVADFLVGLVGIPVYLYSMVTGEPADLTACLLVNTWILLLCTVSIMHLLTVSFDRYMVVVRGRAGSGRWRTRIAVGASWLLGTVIGFLPLMGWHRGRAGAQRCVFMEIMDMRYLIFLYAATMVAPMILMVFFYGSIFAIVKRQVTRMSIVLKEERTTRRNQTRNKVVRSLLIVVCIFLVSWFPLYTLNAVAFFSPDTKMPSALVHVLVVLSHMSSVLNPFIYAFTMPGFKNAIAATLRCERMTVTGSLKDRSVVSFKKVSQAYIPPTFNETINGSVPAISKQASVKSVKLNDTRTVVQRCETDESIHAESEPLTNFAMPDYESYLNTSSANDFQCRFEA